MPRPLLPVDPIRGGSWSALLHLDADLCDAVPPSERALATRAVGAMVHRLEDGPFDPMRLRVTDRRPSFAILVEGLVSRRRSSGSRVSAQLLTAGDVCRPWPRAHGWPSRAPDRWCSHGRTTFAVVDERFDAAARRWPQLATAIHDRLHDQLDRTADDAARLALPRIEDRLLALFWQLADTSGRVTPAGVVVPGPFTHAELGHLTGARRPTVSLALATLADTGTLQRINAAEWLLRSSADGVAVHSHEVVAA